MAKNEKTSKRVGSIQSLLHIIKMLDKKSGLCFFVFVFLLANFPDV